MNTKLLKKARKYVVLLDINDDIATNKGKRVQLVRFSLIWKKPIIITTTRKQLHYTSYQWALKKSKDVILEVAKEIVNNKKWYVFY